MIAEFLKRADKHLLRHDFAAAEEEVRKALEHDPRNVYALAYKERIGTLRLEFEEKHRHEEEERRQQEESLRRIREQRRKLGQQDEEDVAEPASPEALERYRELLSVAWRDGALTDDKEASLQNIRRDLHISRKEHHRLEVQVRVVCFIDAIRTAYEQGLITPTKMATLHEIRKKFGISLEEHLALEPKILWELQQKQRGATVMVIDDEVEFLNVVKTALTAHGYTVMTAASPELALEELENVIPDLILCDIRFPNSELDGFTIYKHLRMKPQFVAVPFIFVTGLREERTLQEGLKVGVDDYITKPFTMTTLLAAMEGKLRRYDELKKRL